MIVTGNTDGDLRLFQRWICVGQSLSIDPFFLYAGDDGSRDAIVVDIAPFTWEKVSLTLIISTLYRDLH
jgi:hypothetical protein